MKREDGQTLKRGDKLYRVFNGALETVTFVEERAVEMPFVTGACEYVFTCKKYGGAKFDCSMDMYEKTEMEAWTRYLRECDEAEPGCTKAIRDAEAALDYLSHEQAKALENIRRMTKAMEE